MSPVVIFAFNRPDKLNELLESLVKNKSTNEVDLYAFIDGPRENNFELDSILTAKSEAILNAYSKKFNSFSVKKYKTNNGLASSVIRGVTEVLKIHDQVIVLEDDLLVSEDFLEYMNISLSTFKKDERIAMISAYSPKILKFQRNNLGYYLNNRTNSWGWATWKNRWYKVKWNEKLILDSNFEKLKIAIKCGEDIPRMINAYNKSRINSWAIQFCYYQFKTATYTVSPFRSRVKNNGFNSQSTHTKKDPLHPIRFNKIKENDYNLRGKKIRHSVLQQLNFNFYYSYIFKTFSYLLFLIRRM